MIKKKIYRVFQERLLQREGVLVREVLLQLYNSSFLCQRSSSSSSRVEAERLAMKNFLQSRLLITQTGCEDDDDNDLFDFQNGRMSRDTDYETDLEMDYEGEGALTLDN